MTHEDHDDGDDRRAEARLAPWFAAARAQPAAVRPQLIEAIVADAARLQAGRSVPAPRRGFSAIGGWPGAAALAASVVIGFAVGATGFLGLSGTALETGGQATQSASDGVTDFFEMASAGD